MTAVLPVPLTTVRTPLQAMGTTGARHLLARIHGVAAARRVALPVELVVGATTKPQA
nr:substrate-binding domain-containing protein [uncultured Tateyamaria sp.]